MNDNRHCLVNILKVIDVLQRSSEKIECINNSCTKPYLGDTTCCQCFNTRLITLYKCDNSLITLPYDGGLTSIFRVQCVSDNSVTVLLIKKNEDDTYSSTNTFATINLNCVCALQCVGDTIINNV